MHLFLDFDGVLRRTSSDPSRFDQDCLSQFEMAVRPLGSATIVIASTWRLAMSLKELRQLFTADIAERIVGVTPEDTSQSQWPRYDEITAYLRKNGMQDSPWLAIDDDITLFPKHAPLLHVDATQGFDSACTVRLWEFAENVGV